MRGIAYTIVCMCHARVASLVATAPVLAIVAACGSVETAQPAGIASPQLADPEERLTAVSLPATAGTVDARVSAGARAITQASTATHAADERALRNRFATAGDSVEPGMELASFLVASERHGEALHVLDLTIKRQRAPTALLARASVLRDLAQNELARRDLGEVVRRRGRAGVAPGTLFELAQVEWLAGAAHDAAKTLEDLVRLHADSDFLAVARQDIDEWRLRVSDASQVAASESLRDALALLRGASRVTVRLRMLESLAGPKAVERGGAARRSIRAHAIAIACGDPSPALRARGLQLAVINDVHPAGLWPSALMDEDAMVRRAAAEAFPMRYRDSAAAALLAALERERDPGVFRAMHAAMRRATQRPGPRCEAGDAGGRSRTARAWRTQCEG